MKWVFSRRLVEDRLTDITVNLNIYGQLASYGGKKAQPGFATLQVSLPGKSTLGDLLAYLGMPTEERGITFINGNLSAMPGLQPDLGHILNNDDRVAFFDLKSMWPFQYRHGAMMTDEMARALNVGEDGVLHHTYGEQH
jgi:hypothetical protein